MNRTSDFKQIEKNEGGRRLPRILIAGILCLAICLIVCGTVSAAGKTGKKKFDYYASLKNRLANDGFDKQAIRLLYGKKGIFFDVNGVSLYFVHREASLNYGQFTEKKTIKNARDYMKLYAGELKAAETAYGVDQKVITAIILVESRLGKYFGKRLVINTLSTMAALKDKAVRKRLWNKISKATTLTEEQFVKKAERKSDWAYGELKAFLKYTAIEKFDPVIITGSYAGAMGIPQFMPSNIIKLAKDGDKDGKIDLFNHADSIMSVASYLSHHGWRPGISWEKAYDVVYEYNHSKYYVNTILEIAKLLKG